MRVFNTEGNLLHAIPVRVVVSSRHQDFIPRIWRRAAQVPSDKATFSDVIRFRAPWPQQCETRIMTRQRCSTYGYRMNRVKENVRFLNTHTHTYTRARGMRSFTLLPFLWNYEEKKEIMVRKRIEETRVNENLWINWSHIGKWRIRTCFLARLVILSFFFFCKKILFQYAYVINKVWSFMQIRILADTVK